MLALHRRGHNLRVHLESIPLKAGDVLLLEASDAAMAKLRETGDLPVLAGAQPMPRRQKRWIAGGAIAAVVPVSALGILPVAVASLIAAVVVITAGCIDADKPLPAQPSSESSFLPVARQAGDLQD